MLLAIGVWTLSAIIWSVFILNPPASPSSLLCKSEGDEVDMMTHLRTIHSMIQEREYVPPEVLTDYCFRLNTLLNDSVTIEQLDMANTASRMDECQKLISFNSVPYSCYWDLHRSLKQVYEPQVSPDKMLFVQVTENDTTKSCEIGRRSYRVSKVTLNCDVQLPEVMAHSAATVDKQCHYEVIVVGASPKYIPGYMKEIPGYTFKFFEEYE